MGIHDVEWMHAQHNMCVEVGGSFVDWVLSFYLSRALGIKSRPSGSVDKRLYTGNHLAAQRCLYSELQSVSRDQRLIASVNEITWENNK